MKTKEEEIKAIKEEQRKLADRLKALEQPEQPECESGDVVELCPNSSRRGIVGETCITETDGDTWSLSLRSVGKRLGTFDEVYIERSKVAEEYVKKSDLSEALADCFDKDAHGIKTRLHISSKFNLGY